MKKIQFGTELVVKNENGGYKILRYYLLETPVGFGYCKLKSYGIGVVRIDRLPGKPDMSECKQIEGVFFDVEEAISFIAQIKKGEIMPTELAFVLENYIEEKVKKQKEKRISNSK